MRIRFLLACLSAALTLAACGGGSDTITPQEAAQSMMSQAKPLAGAQTAPLAAAATVPPADQAQQLMNFAETRFPTYFPGHPTTGTAAMFAYRYYSTGIYLGVVVQQGTPFQYLGVYVVGAFGGTFSNPLYVGQVSQFITPVVSLLPKYDVTKCSDTVSTFVPGLGQATQYSRCVANSVGDWSDSSLKVPGTATSCTVSIAGGTLTMTDGKTTINAMMNANYNDSITLANGELYLLDAADNIEPSQSIELNFTGGKLTSAVGTRFPTGSPYTSLTCL